MNDEVESKTSETGRDKQILNDIQLDAIREVSNIAAAHAATALSKMIGQDIMISVSESRITEVADLPRKLGHISEPVAAVYMDVYGDESAVILLVFPRDEAITLSRLFMKKDISENNEITNLDTQSLCEIGNICNCAYLNAISKFIDTAFFPSPPGVAVDMLGAILQIPATVIGVDSEYAMIMETSFLNEKNKWSGYILFMPGKNTQSKILEKFGVK